MKEAIIIAAAAVVVIAVIVIAVVAAKKKNKKDDGAKAEEVVLIDGVRYTKDDDIEKTDGSAKISHAQGDIVLAVGETKTASKEGPLFPGRYTVLASLEGNEKFNLRVGGFVREFSHGDGVILAENDEITAVSHAVILR
jgi:hypothetical protein